jgi:hypothetical protein
MTGKTRSTFPSPDLGAKSRISHPLSLVLKFGAATLKSARQGRDSVSLTVPKKAFHSRAYDLHLHPLDHAAAVGEAR